MDLTTDFFNDIKRRIKEKRDIITTVFGTPNSGITTVANKLAENIKLLKKTITGKDVKSYIYDTDETRSESMDDLTKNSKCKDYFQEFITDLSNAEEGSIFSVSDIIPLMGKTGIELNTLFYNIDKIVRFKQFSIIFGLHNIENNHIANKSNCVLETAGIDTKNRLNRCIIYCWKNIETEELDEDNEPITVWKLVPIGYIII